MAGRHIKYAVPREDNAYLVTPPANEWEDIFHRNTALVRHYPEWIRSLRQRARGDLASSLKTKDVPERIVVGGHQPELFHAGVWFKNFILNRIAATQQCFPLQVQIDHDVVREIDLTTPCLRNEKLGLVTRRLATNEAYTFLPWENTRCSHALRNQWREVIAQIEEDLRPLFIDPLIARRREELDDLLSSCKTLSQVTSRLRSSMESEAGVENHEIPMSQLATNDTFAEFVYRCIVEPHRTRMIYNESRDDFRRERDISNPGQPVPELRSQGDWVEIPFWVYHTSEKATAIGLNTQCRQAAWVRLSDGDIELASAPNDNAPIRLRSNLSLTEWCRSYREWHEEGVCLRPRALTTTLYLRLFVGDLFVHGIGGGVYDELTDRIASRLWQIEMPTFVVASAALHLPFEASVVAQARPVVGQSKQELETLARQIRSAPDSLLDLSENHQKELKSEFDRMLSQIPPRGQKREWHWEMCGLKDRIRQSIRSRIEQAERQSLELIERTRIGKIVGSREFSFALFPEKSIIPRLKALAEHAVCTECASDKSGIKLKDEQTSTLAAGEC